MITSLEKSQSTDDKLARQLVCTLQGQKWLSQFDPVDQEVAKLLTRLLTLVSHVEFRRKLEELIINRGKMVDGPIGLYAVRELEKDKSNPSWNRSVLPFFEQVTVSSDGKTVSALNAASDQGSEAIVAQIIRQLSKSAPTKYLNHPSKDALRDQKCDALFFVDDFIGSGNRVSDFIDAFWQDKTIVSWLSSKHIVLNIVTYSGTERGLERLQSHRSRPEVSIHRDTPALHMLPISIERRESIYELCKKYGNIALKTRRHFWWGYKKGMASLVFEHGCPNNTPAILWDPDHKNANWIGLFPNRTVDASTTSVFPMEIVQGNPVQTLFDVGQKRLAKSGALLRRGEIGQLVLMVLALVAQGQRKRSAISYATGLSVKDCEKILSKCVEWQFISADRRITPRGLSELNVAKLIQHKHTGYLDVGSDYYYPIQLRAATN